DVVFSKTGPMSRRLAVEFKAHNAKLSSIRKDLEKLLREDSDGLWFHVLENIDSGTVPTLLKKFEASFTALERHCMACRHSLTLAFLVVEKRFWLTRTLSSSQLSAELDLTFE